MEEKTLGLGLGFAAGETRRRGGRERRSRRVRREGAENGAPKRSIVLCGNMHKEIKRRNGPKRAGKGTQIPTNFKIIFYLNFEIFLFKIKNLLIYYYQLIDSLLAWYD